MVQVKIVIRAIEVVAVEGKLTTHRINKEPIPILERCYQCVPSVGDDIQFIEEGFVSTVKHRSFNCDGSVVLVINFVESEYDELREILSDKY